NGLGTLPANAIQDAQRGINNNMSLEMALVNAVATMEAEDPLSDWTVETLLIQSIDSILKKTNLPRLIHPYTGVGGEEEDNYAKQTYIWVWDHYDPLNPAHRIAIIVGVVLAKLAPN